MTSQTAQAFIEALDHNASLAAQYYAAALSTLDAVVDFANGKGYICTREDLAAELKKHPESKIAKELLQFVH